MISNLEQEYEIILNNYKENQTEENKKILEENLIKIDKYLTKNYLEELKKYTQKSNNLNSEQQRLHNIISIMNERKEEREKLLQTIKELTLNVNLENILNIDKIVSFENKLKVVDTIINISSKLNENNSDKAKEILNRKEFKLVLLEFSLIKNATEEEVNNYINSLCKNKIPNTLNNNIKILEYYYDNKNDFPNISIPNMGLIEEKNNIDIDNKKYFIN